VSHLLAKSLMPVKATVTPAKVTESEVLDAKSTSRTSAPLVNVIEFPEGTAAPLVVINIDMPPCLGALLKVSVGKLEVNVSVGPIYKPDPCTNQLSPEKSSVIGEILPTAVTVAAIIVSL
jgi:hypothetical protein